MKVQNFLFILLVVSSVLVSCQKKKKVEAQEKEAIKVDYTEKGRLIAQNTQTALLTEVGTAIRKGGVAYAVAACNIKALPVTDSLSKLYNCSISRVSEKHRNPQNALSGVKEWKVWEDFAKQKKGEVPLDTLINEAGHPVFYKAIYIEMPTCLSCHGDPESYIQPGTLAAIDKYYPDDKARNYTMNQLRGMWKIEFSEGE